MRYAFYYFLSVYGEVQFSSVAQWGNHGTNRLHDLLQWYSWWVAELGFKSSVTPKSMVSNIVLSHKEYIIFLFWNWGTQSKTLSKTTRTRALSTTAQLLCCTTRGQWLRHSEAKLSVFISQLYCLLTAIH